MATVAARVCAIEAALTPEERERFLATFLDRNPNLRGIQVADALDMLYDCDAHLEITEPMWEAHQDEAVAAKGMFDYCIYAALYIAGDPAKLTWEAVAELLGRVKR